MTISDCSDTVNISLQIGNETIVSNVEFTPDKDKTVVLYLRQLTRHIPLPFFAETNREFHQ